MTVSDQQRVAGIPNSPPIVQELQERLGADALSVQGTVDGVPTVWVDRGQVHEVLRYLKSEAAKPYRMLYDLTAVDERRRESRQGQPESDFTVVYHLLSLERNEDLRLKVALAEQNPVLPTITDIWPAANWYEREVWDMFGVRFEGHPHLRRILLPPWWEGHPLRKEHPARATESGPFQMSEQTAAEWDEALLFRPEEWGMAREGEDFDYMFLNMGPQHPGTHGPLRVVLQLRGQEVVDVVCDIGYHHRGAEKMAERQSWHTYIPYTDRIDYLGGAMNNFPYLLAVEQLAGIEVPERAQVIRVMLAELFRIASHLVYYGTFSQDLGAMSPVFYMFNDRERVFDIVEAITGGRMHPAWFRIGGVAQDLPRGWDELVRSFLEYMPGRLRDYERLLLRNRIFRMRTRGIGSLSKEQAVDWGATGPMLRGCGLEWDFRKKRPYGGYEQFEFEIPTGSNGDSYDRALVHFEEMWQSLRIIEQCLNNMPSGAYRASHPLATPPLKERTMHDIETLIHHFLNVSWGPVIPAGEAFCRVEATKGSTSYYLISDGGSISYRTRIRTPSFAHIQMVPLMSRGLQVPDMATILGSIDYVVADVDR
jgi:NADH-quinone oxidoreductase subunit C/D